jgi:hypothetical protein
MQAQAVLFVHMLFATFRSDKWLKFRSFLHVLQFPIDKPELLARGDPVCPWEKETAWMKQRALMKSRAVTYEDCASLMTPTPFVLFLAVSRALAPEQRRQGLSGVPNEYLTQPFDATLSSEGMNRSGRAPHFVALCLRDATQELALEVFGEKNLIDVGFCKVLLEEATANRGSPALLKVFNLLHRFFFLSGVGVPNAISRDNQTQPTTTNPTITTTAEPSAQEIWNIDRLQSLRDVSSVLIEVLAGLADLGAAFKRDEKIIGHMIMLVLQLESTRFTEPRVANISTLASQWIRSDQEKFGAKVKFFCRFCFYDLEFGCFFLPFVFSLSFLPLCALSSSRC